MTADLCSAEEWFKYYYCICGLQLMHFNQSNLMLNNNQDKTSPFNLFCENVQFAASSWSALHNSFGNTVLAHQLRLESLYLFTSKLGLGTLHI